MNVRMNLKRMPAGVLGLIVGTVAGSVGGAALMARAQAGGGAIHKPAYLTRIYPGTDGVARAEQVEIKFDQRGVFKMGDSGAELHLNSPNGSGEWHVGPHRQYVITLKGAGELEVANGQKIPLSPGQIDVIEDTTGKGHITRNFEDRITLWVPLPDPPAK